MKIFALPYISDEDNIIPYDGVADSSVTPWRKPWFLPDFDTRFTMSVCPVAVLSRLGKSIAERFAPRYYEAGHIAIFFKAQNLYDALRERELPTSLAVSFDNSLLISPRESLEKIVDIFSNLEVYINDHCVQTISCHDIPVQLNRAIHHLSNSVTLKTGDIFLINTQTTPVIIRQGDRISLKTPDGIIIHHFTIK